MKKVGRVLAAAICTVGLGAFAAQLWEEAVEETKEVVEDVARIVEDDPVNQLLGDLHDDIHEEIAEEVGGSAGNFMDNMGYITNPFRPTRPVDALTGLHLEVESRLGGCEPNEFCFSDPKTPDGRVTPEYLEKKFGVHWHTVEWFLPLENMRHQLDILNEQTYFRWARVDMGWLSVEYAPPKMVNGQLVRRYDWRYFDQLVEEAARRKIKLLPVIAFSPMWAWVDPHGKHYGELKSVKDWTDYVTAVVSRYGHYIDHWEIWNEPNLERFNSIRLDLDSEERAKTFIETIFLPAAKAVKEAGYKMGLDMKVVGPSLSHSRSRMGDGAGDWDVWMEQYFKLAGDYIDVVSHHIYRANGRMAVRALTKSDWEIFGGMGTKKTVVGLLEKYGMNKKEFWLTEAGWNSMDGGEMSQKANTEDFLKWSTELDWVDKIFIYNLVDNLIEFGQTERETHWGLLKMEPYLEPKPVFELFRRK